MFRGSGLGTHNADPNYYTERQLLNYTAEADTHNSNATLYRAQAAADETRDLAANGAGELLQRAVTNAYADYRRAVADADKSYLDSLAGGYTDYLRGVAGANQNYALAINSANVAASLAYDIAHYHFYLGQAGIWGQFQQAVANAFTIYAANVTPTTADASLTTLNTTVDQAWGSYVVSWRATNDTFDADLAAIDATWQSAADFAEGNWTATEEALWATYTATSDLAEDAWDFAEQSAWTTFETLQTAAEAVATNTIAAAEATKLAADSQSGGEANARTQAIGVTRDEAIDDLQEHDPFDNAYWHPGSPTGYGTNTGTPPSSMWYYRELQFSLPSIDPSCPIIPGRHFPFMGPGIRFDPFAPPKIMR